MMDALAKGRGTLLLADDEETFLRSTGRLLERAGYQCDCARDGHEALERLQANWYDALIADIRMPGNKDLELIDRVRQLDRALPVIVVTGYPTLDTAIHSVRSPVVAYLTKPLELEQLLEKIEESLQHSHLALVLSQVQRWLTHCQTDLAGLARLVGGPRLADPQVFEDSFKALVRRLTLSLSALAGIDGSPSPQVPLCTLLNCPKRGVHLQAILETIEVLQRTKSTFKSKELADLRMKLEGLVKNSG